jgi:hypothetical protein
VPCSKMICPFLYVRTAATSATLRLSSGESF